jgi:hypothetical protein
VLISTDKKIIKNIYFMKERTAHIKVKQRLFITLIFIFIAFICFSNKTNAQGWSFTFQLYVAGNCGGYQPPAMNLPHLGLPTKSDCESLRAQVLAIKYSGNGCTVGYTCTPCTGSDIVTPGQGTTTGVGSAFGVGNPGDVSFDGQFTGKPLFTTHQSSAFEDWAREYRQQLASYGITSILGNTLKSPVIPNIPLTGNLGIDTTYAKLSADFSPAIDPGVVDLRGKQGVVDLNNSAESSGITVLMSRTDEDILKENEWYYKNLGEMKTISDEGIDGSSPSTTDLSESREYKLAEAYLDKIGELPLGELPAYTGKLMLSTINETFKFLNDATINGKYSAEELQAMNPVKVIYNNVAIGEVQGRVQEYVSTAGGKLGVGYLSEKYGEDGELASELGGKLGADATTTLEIIKAKWH